MNTNSPKMTLEEKLVQNLKEEKLYALLGDEDALLELVRRALHEALFQPTRIPRQYGGWDDKDSVVVAAARQMAKDGCAKLVDEMIAQILADPHIKTVIKEAIAVAMPEAIGHRIVNHLATFGELTVSEAYARVEAAIRDKRMS